MTSISSMDAFHWKVITFHASPRAALIESIQQLNRSGLAG